MKKLSGLILFLFIARIIYAQEIVRIGNLYKMNFYQDNLDTGNVVATWQDINNNSYGTVTSFEKVFTFDDTTFLIRQSISNSSILPSRFKTYLVNTLTKKEKLLFGGDIPWCGTGFYLSIATNLLTTKNGVILCNNLERSTQYLTGQGYFNMCNLDSLLFVINVAGEVGDKYLITTSGDDYYHMHYYLEDFDSNFLPTLSHEVKFQMRDTMYQAVPKKSYQVNDSLSLINFDLTNSIVLTNYSNQVIREVDTIANGIYPFWTFKNNKLYYMQDNYLTRRDYYSGTNSFGEPQRLFNIIGFAATDANEDFFAAVYDDTISIYSVADEKLINKIDISSLKNYHTLLIDPPYIYIQTREIIADVVKQPPQKYLDFQLYQNYPNPFNPSTSIRYSIPALTPSLSLRERVSEGQVRVNLIVYDILGREIATLVNEEKLPGNYEVKFDGHNLPSGIYLYRLTASSFSQTKKIVLMK